MWPELAMGAAGAVMVLGGGARIWWARRQPASAPEPTYDEATWGEACAAIGADPHDYRGYDT